MGRDLYSDMYQEFHLGNIILQVLRKSSAYEQTRILSGDILERIRIIRPYIKECVAFMEDGEKRSHLATNITIYLNDDKVDREKLIEREKEIGIKNAMEEMSPLGEYSIYLSFAEVRDFKEKRSLEIGLYSDYGKAHCGDIFLDPDQDFQIQT